MERATGLEPATATLARWYSTIELHALSGEEADQSGLHLSSLWVKRSRIALGAGYNP